ncbi:hypothetical protein Zmor_006112 [Zophobas morio]|uniref:Regulatory protein zeste n=1 Tax=Zophobas morio TaxID=2755281 RepID=A0AA38IR73_9CUCU|nr:hypothetical protein Zmor_006112 [Zophobas morio]
MEQKRERGKNFTEQEKEIALTILERFRPVLEDKKTDGTSLKEKRKAWDQAVEEFNAMSSSGPRTTQQFKFLWSNMKRVAKKTVAAVNKRRYIDEECDEDVDVEQLIKKRREEKKHITKTGGGKYQPSELTEVDARLLAMIESQAKPLANIYDDDNIYHRGMTLIYSYDFILAHIY